MRQELITYDIFCQTIQKLQERNEKISVRTILSHTGGSFAKIATFLKRWRAEQAHVQSQVNHEISVNLRQALLAEVGRAVAETKLQLEEQLTQGNEQLEEAHETLGKQEKLLEEYEQQVNLHNQQMAVMNQMQTELREKIQALEKKLEQSVAALHAADKQAAIAETRSIELEKQLSRKQDVTSKAKQRLKTSPVE